MSTLLFDRLPRLVTYILLLSLMACPLLLVFFVVLIYDSKNVNFLLFCVIFAVIVFNQIFKRAFDTLYLFHHLKSIDLSSENVPIPEEMDGIYRELLGLGFQRLGEIGFVYEEMFEYMDIVWILKNRNSKVVATLVLPNQSTLDNVVHLTSVWQNSALIETTYPVGDPISDSKFFSRVVETDVRDTYRIHQRHMDKFSHLYGDALTFSRFADWKAWIPMYHHKIEQIRLFPPFFKRGAFVSLLATLLVSGFITFIGNFALEPPYDVINRTWLIALISFALVIFIWIQIKNEGKS